MIRSSGPNRRLVVFFLCAAAGFLLSTQLFAENALPPMPTPSPQAVSSALRAGTTEPAAPGTAGKAGSPVETGSFQASVSGSDSRHPSAPRISVGGLSDDSVSTVADPATTPSGTTAARDPAGAPVAAGSPGDQVGYASWYGSRFHGRLTANGEIYDMNKLTAANKTLPFGTVVQVTNLENGRSVNVTINDRGPFVAGRIIDLSRAAAEAIGLMALGVAKVRLHILKMGDGARVRPQLAGQLAGGSASTGPASNLPVIVQLGAFHDLGNAVRLKDFLDKNGFDPLYEKSGDVTRVVLVSVPQTELASVRTRLSKIGIDSILVRHE